jgi:hypothetical protein
MPGEEFRGNHCRAPSLCSFFADLGDLQ